MVITIEQGYYEPEDAKRLSCKKETKTVSFVSENEHGTGEKTAKQPFAPQIRINDADLVDGKQTYLPSSKSCDTPSTFNMKNEQKLERKKSSTNQFSKTNANFHKLFKDVPKDEQLKESFTCALQKDLLYQGKLYISENWIGFNSKVFGKDTRLLIPVLAVTLIKKAKTAILVPNALLIATVTDRYIFVSLLSRDTTYKLLKSVCSHLDNASNNNSPNPSSVERSFLADQSRVLPIDLDFNELDGLVRHRRKELEESSSTGSYTPESEVPQEFPVQDLNSLVTTQLAPYKAASHKLAQHRNGHMKFLQNLGFGKMVSLNGLLLFYAILVCLLLFSTFYMQSRIGYLEERLSSISPFKDRSFKDLTLDPGLGNWHINANAICDELTANLAKLDKIQRNLQRLLEDTN